MFRRTIIVTTAVVGLALIPATSMAATRHVHNDPRLQKDIISTGIEWHAWNGSAKTDTATFHIDCTDIKKDSYMGLDPLS